MVDHTILHPCAIDLGFVVETIVHYHFASDELQYTLLLVRVFYISSSESVFSIFMLKKSNIATKTVCC